MSAAFFDTFGKDTKLFRQYVAYISLLTDQIFI
jgi:hypothetical protein